MADFKLTSKTEKSTPANDFWIHIVDPSDTSADPLGTSFKMSRDNFLGTLFDGLFTSLTDAPNTLTGQGLKTVQVNAAGNALIFEFAEFLALNDVTETTFTTKQGQVVTVNAAATGLEFTINSFINLADVSETTLEFNQGKAVVVYADLGTDPATYSLRFQNFPTYEDIFGGNAIIKGGLTFRGTGLNYTIWADKYIINGQYFNTPIAGNVTNNDGDATFARFDVYFIEVDTSDPPIPSVGILQGTPSASPVIPTLDLESQVQVSVRLIAASETVDPNISIETIFNEDADLPTEWDNVLTPAGANLASVVDPKVGTVSALFPAYVSASVVSWQDDVMTTYRPDDLMAFWLKVPGVFVPQATINIKLINSVSLDYWNLTLNPANFGDYGYDRSIADWQLISVQLSNLVPSSRIETEYDVLQITFERTPILSLDNIVLQTGIPQGSNTIGIIPDAYIEFDADAKEIKAFTDGVQRAKIDNTGIVLTTGSVQVPLIDTDSVGRIADAHIEFDTVDQEIKAFTNGLQRWVTDDAGNFGVGIAVPTVKLHVFENSTNLVRIALGNTNGTASISQQLSDLTIRTPSVELVLSCGTGGTTNNISITRALTDLEFGAFKAPVIRTTVYTVATLPTGTIGDRAFVSDSNQTLAAGIGLLVVGGGANPVPVYYSGSNWRIG
jgi:hypothetical protein